MLISRFYPYLLKFNGIESITTNITEVSIDENSVLTINTASGTVLKASPENSCLVAGSSFTDNLYMFLSPEATGKRIVCHIKDDTVLFVSTTMDPLPSSHREETEARLYYYDNSTNAAVFSTQEGEMMYFLSNNAEIVVNGQKSAAESLLELTDHTFKIYLESVNSHSFKRITKLETGGNIQ